MKFVSTRGGGGTHSLEECLMKTVFPDGGIAFPEVIPELSRSKMAAWRSLSFRDLTEAVLRLFVDDSEIPDADLAVLVDRLFQKLDTDCSIELVNVRDGLYVAELFHSPTLAFKDHNMNTLAQLLDYFLRKRNRHSTLLSVTSGDTGAAAIVAFADLPTVDVIVILPGNQRISTVQEKFLTTSASSNIHMLKFDSFCSALDDVQMRLLTDVDLVRKHGLATSNSLNIGRILGEICHHVYAYLQVADGDEEIKVVVPTGGVSNGTALLIAQRMGLNIRPVFVNNSNSTTDYFVRHGALPKPVDTVKTVAPSMDEVFAYNLERVMFMLTEGDGPLVRAMMEGWERGNEMRLPPGIVAKISGELSSFVADDGLICQTSDRYVEQFDYWACPHTATALAYYDHVTEDGAVTENDESSVDAVKTIVIGTGSPAKFTEFFSGMSRTAPVNSYAERVVHLPDRSVSVVGSEENWYHEIVDVVEAITARLRENCE